MRLAFLAALVASLVAPHAAFAKGDELAAVEICGADECRTFRGTAMSPVLGALMTERTVVARPRATAPYYVLRYVFRRRSPGARKRVAAVYFPTTRMIREGRAPSTTTPPAWIRLEAWADSLLRMRVRGLAPFGSKRPTAARRRGAVWVSATAVAASLVGGALLVASRKGRVRPAVHKTASS